MEFFLFRVMDVFVAFSTVCVILGVWALVVAVRLFRDWLHPSPLPSPPGPWGLPILGSLPFLRPDAPFLTLEQWRRHYGAIYRLRLGSVPVVVLASPTLIRQAFKKEAFCGKPPLYVTNGIMAGYGLISAEGELWREQRRFTVHCLRDFGLTKARLSRAKLEERIVQEVNVFVAEIHKFGGESFDVHPLLRLMVANLMATMVFGRRYEEDDPAFAKQLNELDLGSASVPVAGVLNFFPVLRFLPRFRRFLKGLMASQSSHHKFLKEVVDDHRGVPLDADAVRDFVDAYLLEMDKREDEETASHFSEIQLLHLLADLFGAGTDTTKVTLKWAFLFLMINPEVQKKAQDEMDSVIGRNRNPNLDDVSHCPYTEALVFEVQRLANIVPLGAPHGTIEDTSLDGYYIPKNTMIIPLLWSVHMDPTNWPEPEELRPERFIDANGKTFKPDSFLPFSVGRRTCVGEELARMTLFLLISTLLHRFTLKWPDSTIKPDLTPLAGFTISPKPYRMCASARD